MEMFLMHDFGTRLGMYPRPTVEARTAVAIKLLKAVGIDQVTIDTTCIHTWGRGGSISRQLMFFLVRIRRCMWIHDMYADFAVDWPRRTDWTDADEITTRSKGSPASPAMTRRSVWRLDPSTHHQTANE